MDEKTKSAIDHLWGMMNLLDGTNAEDRQALAHLQAMAEENEGLRIKVAHEQDFINENGGLVAENERLRAEVRDIVDDLSFLQPATCAEEWGARLSQVAARRLLKADAALARYRRFDALIEAAEGADKNLLAESINNLEFLLEKFTTAYHGAGQDLAILRAALSCREEKPSEPKGGDGPFDDGLSPEERKKQEEQFKYDEMERRHEQSVEDAYDRESEQEGGGDE